MTLLSSELKNFFVSVRQYGKPVNFLYCKSGMDYFERSCYETLEVRMNFFMNT